MPLSSIRPSEYEEFRRFLEDACGILLGENKHYLVQSRLGKLVRENAQGGLGELVIKLRAERQGGVLRERVIEAMTTNETFWFRDRHPFTILEETVLPDLSERRTRNVRIWSAACSTGQEPYSISMAVQQYLSRNTAALSDVKIMATDISTAVLEEAKAAYYDTMQLARGLDNDMKQRYFERDASHWEERWQVRREIRQRVQFTLVNLQGSYSSLGKFDIVFCRNVLIYFSGDSKKDILSRMAGALNPGGYLFLGASESISQYSDAFEMVRCPSGTVYRKK
ncbi:chemotaxis protein methyltransferase CheR [Thiogranum longum]|uniref:Chemotaxis protein methyltransferase n=1 Tax=Thiogranum longum TaxID=1537524 RepID=A0A4R1HNM9_9GAMM|nr:protein-glutamate O-methyltransferase CheR [Thiogranum longum]TCK18872.1 chemotaxis protein methyltransferase CheR [Thiogranum longum]